MKRRQAITWLILIGVVAAGALLWLWVRHRNAEGRLLARGIIAMQQNDVNQAAGLFREARRRYPRSYPATYWLAVAELRLGQTDEARRTAQEASQLAPQKPEPWVVRAAAFRFDANRKLDALARVPSETEFLAAEALCGEALAALEQAEQIAGSKENADVLAERGLCRRTMADLYRWREKTAQAEADRLAGTDATRAAALRKESEAAGQKRREAAEQGLASLVASLRSRPDNARAAEAAQDLAMELGKYEVVLEAYEQLAAAKAVSERAAIQAAQ
ncbi:MAG TPA: tetratricopeptide repeat protein, partial [Phycisphaerae bacterium]|nr:tetratricopeptide repeat protein [Phycisphaerae bacterium]